MNANIVKRMEVGAKPALAVDTGLSAEQFARSGYARTAADPGCTVGIDGVRTDWVPDGTIEADGHVYVHGPWFDGIPFLELAEKDPSAALRTLLLAAGAAAKCDRTPFPLPASLFVGKDGNLLLLPEKIAARALEAAGAALDGAVRWKHTALRYEESLVFTFAALVYRTLSGKAPFAASNAEFLAADMRDGNALPLRLAVPGIDLALAGIVDRALGLVPGGEGRGKPTLEDLKAALSRALETNPVRSVSEDERSRVAAERERFESRLAAIAGRKRFLRKHGAKIIAISVSVLIAGGIVWNMVAENAARFTTRGLSPKQVVQTYYEAFNELDTEKMQACVTSGAGKNDIDGATSMYVVFKVRSAYERDSGVLSASKWVASGSPETTKTVFGLVDLAITSTDKPEEFVVRYRFFAPGQKAETREDRLVLFQKKGRWLIERLERRTS